MKADYALLFVLLLANTFIFSQSPDIEWAKCFGGSQEDVALTIIQTNDNGFIQAGYSYSTDGDVTDNYGERDCWVVKIDSTGILEWQKNYGGTSFEEAYAIRQTPEGGYIISGYTSSIDVDVTATLGGRDCWIIKINSVGDIEWQKNYGGSNWEQAFDIILTIDGGYIFAGSSESSDGDLTSNNGDQDIWIVKIDSIGNIEWQKSLGGSGIDKAESIQQAPDGSFIIAGDTGSSDGDVTGGGFHGGFSDFWVIKLDEEGSLQWQKCFGGTKADHAESITKMHENGSFAIAGNSYSSNGDITDHYGSEFSADYWVIKVDSGANLLWEKSLGGTSLDFGYSIKQASDDGYVVAGYTQSTDEDVTDNHGGSDSWIVKLDTSGIIQWQKCLGGSAVDKAYSIYETMESDFVVGGLTGSSDGDVSGYNGAGDCWIVKLANPCVPIIFYADSDSDGFGDVLNDTVACEAPLGFVADSTDCNDADNTIYPTAIDICNGVDDNCNDLIDEDAVFITYYMDADGDGFGNPQTEEMFCSIQVGYVLDNTDCDDTNENIYPGATEIFNGIDDNCDGVIDEGLSIDKGLLNTFKIFPNPVINELIISTTLTENYTIEIFNAEGKLIFTQLFTSSSSNTIYVNKFPSGIYFLKFKTEDGIAGFKFLKE